MTGCGKTFTVYLAYQSAPLSLCTTRTLARRRHQSLQPPRETTAKRRLRPPRTELHNGVGANGSRTTTMPPCKTTFVHTLSTQCLKSLSCVLTLRKNWLTAPHTCAPACLQCRSFLCGTFVQHSAGPARALPILQRLRASASLRLRPRTSRTAGAPPQARPQLGVQCTASSHLGTFSSACAAAAQTANATCGRFSHCEGVPIPAAPRCGQRLSQCLHISPTTVSNCQRTSLRRSGAAARASTSCAPAAPPRQPCTARRCRPQT